MSKKKRKRERKQPEKVIWRETIGFKPERVVDTRIRNAWSQIHGVWVSDHHNDGD